MTKFTIIIPTFNRPGYLKRLLDYYNKCEKGENDFEIIVADSSSDENKIRNKELITAFPGLRILYLSSYSETINPWYKHTDSINHVQSDYCVFCADDDFVTLKGIRESVDFLQANPDFAVAHGYYISFHLEGNEAGKRQFCWQPTYLHESIAFADPAMRLSCHLSDYSQATFYAVHKTEFQKMLYAELLKSEVSFFFFGELLLTALTIIYGKLKCLDVLYAARTEHTDRYRPLPLSEAIEAGTYSEEYAKFRDCLATYLSKQSQLNIEESGQLVDKAMATYLKKYFYPPKSKMGYITTRMGQILDNLHLPGWLNRGIRRLYEELIKPRYIKKRSNAMPPSAIYCEDLNRIRCHVLSYPI